MVISITRADGLRANYFHLNDDNPGTGDGAAPAAWRIPAAVQHGTHVQAGQIVGFMGDSGNAVGVPHLHFEIRRPDGTPINPYPALVAAQRRDHCRVALGPWANLEPSTGVAAEPVVTVEGWGGARWLVTARGAVIAASQEGSTAGGATSCSGAVPGG